jgi:hypothetical protein
MLVLTIPQAPGTDGCTQYVNVYLVCTTRCNIQVLAVSAAVGYKVKIHTQPNRVNVH